MNYTVLEALDLFCGAGGATRGLQEAGFRVTGVDINPQRRYCGDVFIQADALTVDLSGYDFIWASPPCQYYSNGAKKWGTTDNHEHLIPVIRDRLIAQRIESGCEFVIENIVPAKKYLIDPIMMCGTQFGLGVFRHRLFELSSPVSTVPWVPCECCDDFICNIHDCHVHNCVCPSIENWGRVDPYQNQTIGNCLPHLKHDGAIGDGRYYTITGHSGGSSRRDGWKNCGVEKARMAMGIDWMTWAEMAEAIPPAYSRLIGRLMIDHIYGDTGGK